MAEGKMATQRASRGRSPSQLLSPNGNNKRSNRRSSSKFFTGEADGRDEQRAMIIAKKVPPRERKELLTRSHVGTACMIAKTQNLHLDLHLSYRSDFLLEYLLILSDVVPFLREVGNCRGVEVNVTGCSGDDATVQNEIRSFSINRSSEKSRGLAYCQLLGNRLGPSDRLPKSLGEGGEHERRTMKQRRASAFEINK